MREQFSSASKSLNSSIKSLFRMAPLVINPLLKTQRAERKKFEE